MEELLTEEEEWPQLPDDNPYRIHLAKLLHAITHEVQMQLTDIVLVMMHLNTEERIERFTNWVRLKFDGKQLHATSQEICRAAVWIHKGRTDLP